MGLWLGFLQLILSDTWKTCEWMGDKERRPQLRCLQDSRCPWYVHTCEDNDTGRGWSSSHCQLRPNKHAGTEIQKAKCTRWLSVGGSSKSFLFMSSDKWEQQQNAEATEPVGGTLKSLSWACKIGCVDKWVMPGPAQFPLQIQASQASPSTKHTPYKTYIHSVYLPRAGTLYDWPTPSLPHSGSTPNLQIVC